MTPTTVTKKPIAVTAAKHRSTLSMNATPAKKNYSSFFVIYRYSNRCLARTPQGSLRLLQPEQNAFKR
jgi:hypothetical protein